MEAEEVVAPEDPEDVELEPGEEELELDAVDDEPEEAELTVRVLRRELEEDFFLAVEGLTETVVVVAAFVVEDAALTTCVLPVAMTAVRIAVPAAAAAAVQRVIRFVRRSPAVRARRLRVLGSFMATSNHPLLATASQLFVSLL